MGLMVCDSHPAEGAAFRMFESLGETWYSRWDIEVKIGLVAPSVLPVGTGKYGGIEKLIYDFAETLVSLGHGVSVAAPKGSLLPKGAVYFPTVDLPEQQDRDDLAFNSFAPRMADMDVVHDFSHGHVYARKHPDRPTLNTIWDNLTVRYEKASKNIGAVSEWQRKGFEELYGQKARIAPVVCANENRYKPGEGVGDRFLIVGKMSPDKAIIGSMALCKLLNVGADVVGSTLPNDDPSYRHAVMRVCDGNQFTFWGEVDDEVKIRLMQRALAVVNARTMPEAHWHVGVEAMLCGTPVIVYGHSSYPEIVANGVSGYVCRPSNEGDFLTAMRYVRNLNRQKIREFALQYSRTKVVGECVKVYEDVAKGTSW